MKEDPREEISLTFGEKEFRVRPTFQVIAGIEAALDQPAKTVGMKALSAGMSAVEREQRGAGREISLTELAVVIYWMLKDKDGAPKSPSEAGEALLEYGTRDLLLPVGLFLTRAQRGHREHIKDQEEAAERARKAKESGDIEEAGQDDGAAGPRMVA